MINDKLFSTLSSRDFKSETNDISGEGRVIYFGKTKDGHLEIDVSTFESGIYLVQLKSGNVFLAEKISIAK